MKIIVVLDNGNGMSFTHRRQSRDQILIENIYQYKQSTTSIEHFAWAWRIHESVDVPVNNDADVSSNDPEQTTPVPNDTSVADTACCTGYFDS